ncbi:hypothetical protein BDR06DRAFT_977269 [Suillus hirtellus]|nr:hypothetical protein BDR06DRAFT_977269 [Suillus hirtellus]
MFLLKALRFLATRHNSERMASVRPEIESCGNTTRFGSQWKRTWKSTLSAIWWNKKLRMVSDPGLGMEVNTNEFCANGRGRGDANQNAEGNQNHQIPQRILQIIPRPHNVMFTLTEMQLRLMYVTWAGTRVRMRQELYHPEVLVQPRPQPPVLSEEARAMMVLWITRECQVFEMEMDESGHLLGLRDLWICMKRWRFWEQRLDTCVISYNLGLRRGAQSVLYVVPNDAYSVKLRPGKIVARIPVK